MTCPFKAGDKIEGKETIEGFLGLPKDVWHPAIVEKIDGNQILISCPEVFGEKKIWLEYFEDWFREVKEESK